MANSDSSTPTFVDYGGPAGAREAYPAWSSDRQIPLSKEEIEDIFLDLTQKFGFQRDSMRNMVSLCNLCHVLLIGCYDILSRLFLPVSVALVLGVTEMRGPFTFV